MVRKVSANPAAVCAVPGTTAAPLSAQSVPLVNIVNPNVQTSPFDRTFNDPGRDNATFYLAPGERGVITLRAYCEESTAGCTRDLVASLQGTTALGVVAQSANCVTGDNGLGDSVGGNSTCAIADGPPKDIYDPIPPSVEVLNPTITAPDIVVEATDADNNGTEPVGFTIHATDNVAVATVSCLAGTTAVTLQSVSSDQYLFSGVFPVGATGVTCTALDSRATPAPNAAEVVFSVVVKDVTPPSFDIPAGSDPGSPFVPSNPAEASGPNGAVVTYTNPPANDTNGGPVTVTCASSGGLVSGSTFPIGTTDINCVATDISGISTPPTNLFDITVADNTPPVVTLAGAAAVTLEAGSAFVDPGATATDLVSGSLAATASGTVNSLVPGVYTVTYSATDGFGNVGTITRVITVVDSTAPVIGSVANLIAEATSPAGATVSYATPSATDTVSASVLCAPVSGSTFPLGVTTVTCTATDPAHNTSLKTFTVTVRDTTAPVIGAVANITAEATSAAGAIVTYATPSVSDAVGATIACAQASGTLFPIGTRTVICTATDAALNSSSKSFTVTVSDTRPPIVTATANPTTLLWSPNKTMTPVTVSGTISDATFKNASFKVVDEYKKVQPSGAITVAANGSYSFVVSLEAYRDGNDANGRIYTITVTAVDQGNRSASAQAIVTVPHNQ